MTEDADEEALKGVEAFEQAGLSADEHRKAQFGMPVGTTNTYALEGMEDMSPDEYMQAMLDKQMEERRQRRESSGGEVRAPLDSYFAQFNGKTPLRKRACFVYIYASTQQPPSDRRSPCFALRFARATRSSSWQARNVNYFIFRNSYSSRRARHKLHTRMCATKHAPRDPFYVFERRHGLAEIVERGVGVLVERPA